MEVGVLGRSLNVQRPAEEDLNKRRELVQIQLLLMEELSARELIKRMSNAMQNRVQVCNE